MNLIKNESKLTSLLWILFWSTEKIKEKEYKEVLEAYNERSKEKALLVNRLIEVKSLSLSLISCKRKKNSYLINCNQLLIL